MPSRIAFITNVHDYVGPPAVESLLSHGWAVFAHADVFGDSDARTRFEALHPQAHASASTDVADFVSEGLDRFGRIDALISNDVPKNIDREAETDNPFANFAAEIEKLLMAPARLVESALPAMKSAGAGSILLVTSGAPCVNPSMPAPYGYIAGRGATNALSSVLAGSLAPYGIQVNALAPYFLHSQFFFPVSDGEDADQKYADVLKQWIPMQRFGKPDEIGALVAFLVSGEAHFVSGQVIAFSGAGA